MDDRHDTTAETAWELLTPNKISKMGYRLIGALALDN